MHFRYMNSPYVRFAICSAVLACCTLDLAAGVKTWDGGGGDLSWQTAANWSPDGVPGADDDVVIDLPAQSINVAYATATTSIASLQCTEQLTINSGTLAINGPSQIRALVAFVGILEGSGDITITEQMQWLSTNIRGAGRLIIAEQAALNLAGNGRGFSRRVDIYGTTTWTTGGWTFVNAAAQVHNYGTFTINATTETLNATTTFTDSVFNNFGTIIKTGPQQGGFSNCCNTVLVTFNNSGSVQINQGRLTIPQGVNSGPFVVTGPAGTELEMKSALPLLFEPTATISGNGNLHVYVGPAGHITCNAPVTTTAAVTVVGGPIDLNAEFSANEVAVHGTLGTGMQFNGPTTTIATLSMPDPGVDSLVSFNGSSSTVGVLNMRNGRLAGTGVLDVLQQFIVGPVPVSGSAILSGTGSTVVAAGATFTLAGPMTVNRVLEVRGTGSMSFGTLTMNNGRIRNLGSLAISGGAQSQILRSPGGGPAVIENHGTLVQTGGVLEWAGQNGGATLENYGTVNLNGGLMWLNGGGVNSGAMHTVAGTTLQFGKTTTHSPSSSIDGPGKVWFLNGTHDLQGTYAGTGPLEVYETAVVTISNTFVPSEWVINRGSLTINADQQWVGFNQLQGTLGGSGDIHVTNLAILRGTHSGTGHTIIEPGATLHLPVSSQDPTIARVIESFGTIIWQSSILNFANGTVINHGTVTAGEFLNQAARGLSGVNAWINEGTFQKITNTTVTFNHNGAPLPFDNNGAVNVSAGTLEILSGGQGSGPVDVASGSTLRVGGSLGVGDCDVLGVLHMTASGSMVSDGTFTLHPSTTLQVTRSSNPGPVIQSTTATIAGHLSATYAPAPTAETHVNLLSVSEAPLTGTFGTAALSPKSTLLYQPQQVLWRIYRPGDADHDGDVDVTDLLMVINAWGACALPPAPCDADVTNDGTVSVTDLLLVINNWGP